MNHQSPLSAFSRATVTLLALACAWQVQAKVSPAEAAKLGKELTCIGADKSAGKAGTAEWSGKWLGAPTGVNANNPYAGEKPLYTVTAQNMAQYEALLTPGLQAMLKKYPTFKVPVYPSRRDFRYADWVCERAKENALNAETVDGGMGIKAVRGSVAFPLPKNGTEASMNLLYNTRTSEWGIYDQAVVYPNGNIAWGQAEYRILNLQSDPDAAPSTVGNYFGYANITTLKPVRNKGTDIISHESYNTKTMPRLAWMYDPGTRRVRQLPTFGFDMPDSSGGFRTIDDDRIFNGSTERYDWNLLGKQEMIIPYNAYQLDDPKVKYKDMLSKNHLNPDLMRYEVHRVWVLEAKLKSGYRHQYARRVMYLDEDSWQAVLADNYDSRGQLWRVAMVNTKYLPDAKVFFTRVALYHDLSSGAYMADRLTNESPKTTIYGKATGLQPHMFTQDYIRARGK